MGNVQGAASGRPGNPADRKRAVVVGCRGGIGSAVVRRLTRDGWLVIGMDRVLNAYPDTAETDVGMFVGLDLCDPLSIESAFAQVAKSGRIDLLAICSGVVDAEKVGEVSLKHWQDMLAVNLTGPFLCCKSAYPLINDGGRIVMLGSLAGKTGGVLTGAAYAASKGGVESLAKSMAQELAPRRITVNVVAPGAVETPMVLAHPPERRRSMAEATPLKRLGQPDEIGAAVAYLASPEAGFMTGAVLNINGGIRMD